MATFPALKTGAVAQYGSDRMRQFSTQVLRFVDGSEQRFPGYGAALLQWVIRLDLLDESELENLEQFFEDEGGRAGSFSFTDPWDGTVYPSCSFASDDLSLQFEGVARGKTQVVVKENRT
jgi:phage-related protein